MKWKKLGLIYSMEEINDLLISHASNPLPVYLGDDLFRVFFSARDAANRSSVGAVDLNIETREIKKVHKNTFFKYGVSGSFYSHGVSIGNCYNRGDDHYILFMGWNIPENQHWRGDIGRLRLENNYTFELDPPQAFIEVDSKDLISLSYPFVIYHEGVYKMWYGSTINWKMNNGEMLHVINYASSADGEVWVKHGLAIPYELGVAQAFSRPTVLIDQDGYHMWYSYRSGTGEKYRIGYAHSSDGLNWQRKHNEVGIWVSESGWDSEMICYPYVLDYKNNRYMFYNGNQFGKAGFGLAILEK